MKKILITGSSGTIGTRLCEKLLEKDIDFVGADWHENQWQKSVQDRTINVDLRDEEAMKKIPGDVDFIVHLAANARVYDLVENPAEARDNLLTVFNTLEFARQNNVKKFMFASSRECYGNTAAEIVTEDMVRVENCESPYTASKVAGEAMVEAYKRCYGVDSIIFRFSNVYGMYDNSNRVVPLFIRQAKADEMMRVFGKDKCLDFTYIDDTVTGILQAIDQFDAVKNETYNLAFGEGTTILRLAEAVKELLGSNSEIQLEDNRIGEVIRYTADVSRARKAFGFAPSVSFDEGIAKTIEWYATNT